MDSLNIFNDENVKDEQLSQEQKEYRKKFKEEFELGYVKGFNVIMQDMLNSQNK